MRRFLAVLGFSIGLVALMLQLAVTIPASLAAGRSVVLSLVYYFSFFTILTNIGLVLIYAATLYGDSTSLSLFRTPLARATGAACITLVMAFYHLVLAATWSPQGLFWLSDIALHYVTPSLYLIWFIGWNRSGKMHFTQIPAMLAAPFVYIVYIMARGAVLGEYPYPTLDAANLGYARAAQNIFVLLAILAALNAAAVLVDRFLPITPFRE